MELVYIGLAAFSGGCISSLLGWLDAKEPFDPRKSVATLMRTLVAVILFVSAFQITGATIGISDLLAAFIGGVGFDAGGKRLINVLKG